MFRKVINWLVVISFNYEKGVTNKIGIFKKIDELLLLLHLINVKIFLICFYLENMM